MRRTRTTKVKVTTFTEKCLEFRPPLKPEGLKKLTNWALWNQLFQNYLRQILGPAKIPLIYLSCDEEDVPDGIEQKKDFGRNL